jgi:integrase/ribosomal protein L40E
MCTPRKAGLRATWEKEGFTVAIQIFCTSCKTSNGMDAKKCSKCGTVFTRDKKYRVCVSVKGKRLTRVADNLTIAREVEAALKGDLVRDEFEIADHRAQEKPITLADVWDRYLPWAKENKKSWRDDECYYGRHIEPRFSSRALSDISAFDIEKMKTELKKSFRAYDIRRMETEQEHKPEDGKKKTKKKPRAPEKLLSAQTIKHQIVIIRRLFNLARKWNLYDGKNPVDSVSMPHIDNEKTEFLTDDELSRLLDTLENWPCRESAALIKFAMFTGCRRGEILGLKWDDVDLQRGMITLRGMDGDGPKGKKVVTIPIDAGALEILQERQRTSLFVFPGENGKQRTDFKGPWLRIRKAAGLPDGFRFHGLRHNLACSLVSNGVDLIVVRELLTHKDVKTTLRYAHLKPDAVKRAASQIGELLKPKHGQVLKIVK